MPVWAAIRGIIRSHNVPVTCRVGNGRFASADTLVPDPANPLSYNRFSYVENRPIAFVDPTGHFSESAIYGYLYAHECNLSHECASQLFQTWQSDEEWWAMLLEAEAGDVLFGSFSAGPNQGFVHFRFNGSGRDVLTGITYSDAKGDHVFNNFWGVNLRDIRGGETSKLYHGSPLSFNWGGLFRHPAQGGMPLVTFLRESAITADSYFTAQQVRLDGKLKSLIAGAVGGYVGGVTCGGKCALGVSLAGSWVADDLLFSDWDKYGRQVNDRYVTVSHYDLTFRYSRNGGDRLIYYSGLGNGVIPFWIR